jgi:two-component system response regulator AtoC
VVRAAESVNVCDLPPSEVVFGQTASMTLVRQTLERVADTNIPVLLQGESGTGKEIMAKLLHVRSCRAHCPLVKVNCPALPHSLIETELFGYEKGSFTGAYSTKRGRVEAAHMGTLFMDEIGSLDLSVQAKLLQLLQDGSFVRVGGQEPRKVDIRVVSAANRDLRSQTQDGTFRLDLFFRINAVSIELPPLRERTVDLPTLAKFFLGVYGRAFRCEPRPLSRNVMRLMQSYDWPGNIRQLENLLRSYVLIGSEEALESELLSASPINLTPHIDLAKSISLKQITKKATQDLEQQIILKVLQANGWSRQKTAKWLKISYRSLLYKLRDASLLTVRSNSTSAKPISEAASLAETAEKAKRATADR